jgi:FdhD protein
VLLPWIDREAPPKFFTVADFRNASEQLKMEPALVVRRQVWRANGLSSGNRSIPEETAVAITYNGGTYAVMMTTPQDLEDFAVGFSLSEGVISSATDI